MSRRGGPLDRMLLVATAAVTTWFATLAWRGFSEAPGRFLEPLAMLAVAVVGTGVALRAARLPGSLVVPLQVLLTGLVAASLVAGTPVVTVTGWAELGDQLAGAVSSSQKYAAPVPSSVPPIAPLLVLGGWLCLVAVDVCVGTLRRVPLAGLPLLTVYSIPVSLLAEGVPWWSFAGAAAGFLLLLFLQQRDATNRWGRGLAADGGASGLAAPPIRNAAASMGAGALVLAVLIPQFVPTLSLSVLGFGPGDGTGGDITVENPMADLRRDLLRDEDLPLIRFTTDNPTPSYLRIAALTRFTDNEWTTGDRDIPDHQVARGAIPMTDIDPAIPRQRFRHEVSALPEFDSRWLPTAFPAERVTAEGDWRYDVATLDFLAADGDGELDTAGLDYEMTEVVLDLTGQELADAATWSGKVSRDFIDLPDGFPAFVRSLAQEVTRDHPSRYEKAVALQQWFREDGGFSYSLDNVPPGNGTDELVAFLSEGAGGRVGYCEQFAAAMAVMARSLGIPARVAVGFLTPDRVGPGTWEYSTFDLHAWPELYFAGAGWVRFEPTPPDRAPGVPSYTEDRIPRPDDPDFPQQPEESPGAQQDPGRDPRLDEGALPEGQDPGQAGGVAWQPLLGGLAGGLLVSAILLLPRAVRRSRARARLQGEVEAAWQELRATALDLGLAWPEHRSPRETRRHLVPFLADPEDQESAISARGAEAAPAADAALHRLVHAVERIRYAPPGPSVAAEGSMAADVRTVTASLRAGAPQRARRRADWWPASVLPWRRTPEPVASTLTGHGGVVDHVG